MKRPATTYALAACCAIGLVLWIFALRSDAMRAYAALLVNYLFFVSLAGGLAVWPAIVRASNGEWMGEIEKIPRSAIACAIPSLLVFIVLWAGSAVWAPWVKDPKGHDFWLNNAFLFIREGLLLCLFWGTAYYYVRKRRIGSARFLAGLFCVCYCAVFTMIGYDLVMALEPDWRSNLLGAYFFISALYIAAAGWAVLSIAYENYTPERLKDVGKLILTFCLLTTYMMYSQLLPLWYENIPEQTTFLRQRMNVGAWMHVSAIVAIVVYSAPIAFLFTSQAKKTPWFLAGASLVILAGMWVERWWLAAAQLHQPAAIGLAEASALLLIFGLFAIAYDWKYRSSFSDEDKEPGDG